MNTTIDNNAIVAAIANATTLEDAQAVVRLCEQNLSDAKARLREIRGESAKAKSAPRACECGCGGITSGGMFLPGHDAKMRSALLRQIRGTDEGTTEESEAAALAKLQGYAKLAHGIGTWDLGRDRKARAEKELRKVTAEAEKAAKIRRDEAERAQRDSLKTKSREEQSAEADERIAQKERAIADAKAQGTRVVPQS